MSVIRDIQEIRDLEKTAVRLSIRFTDVDMMQIVHHAAYLHYFEQLRFSFLRNILNLDVGILWDQKIGCPVLKCDVKYFRPLRFEDEPMGYTMMQIHPTGTFRFEYWIYRKRKDQRACTCGSTTHCFVSQEIHLLMRTPPLFAEALAVAMERYPTCFRYEHSPTLLER